MNRHPVTIDGTTYKSSSQAAKVLVNEKHLDPKVAAEQLGVTESTVLAVTKYANSIARRRAIHLAQSSSRHYTIADISKRTNIKYSYLANLFHKLKITPVGTMLKHTKKAHKQIKSVIKKNVKTTSEDLNVILNKIKELLNSSNLKTE